MPAQADVSDLERRKKVRVRLRPDLDVTVQKYEGRTYWVVKDPVCLRYYRFKEQEKFLLDLMDGDTTLDDAQKAFEKRFRPERLTLENLEGFASQLLNAGLAQNENPQAGKQLFDRFKKRRRRTMASSFLNILYIKIPLYDPDRLLTRMLKPLRFIFTTWFLLASVAVMLAALGLVLVQWNYFYSKLPSAQEFFSFKTLIYLWFALGAVKIIHEFGHGLSCKAFGGEVHEMGLLLLVFSPCLYCNVSDSWTLPSKWKRIIIGAAGIYVELIIASFATFIWWFTDSGTFINNLCMSLMIVCSVSTVIFNANPLMRFDGYYILADWLEIPNLRDRSNKFLQYLMLEYCLGIEQPPEPYMTRTRQILFVTYAVTSYLYRWLITFTILYFMYTFLKPYKLGALSYALGTGAVGTMFGWPIYRLGRALHRRGRVPDMKPGRVWLTVGVAVVALVILLAVPIPGSVPFLGVRVEGLAVIQVKPENAAKLMVPEMGGFLEERFVEDGERVQAGDTIARLSNPELETQLRINQRSQSAQRNLRTELSKSELVAVRTNADKQEADAELKRLQMEERYLKEQLNRLTLRAPRDGIIMDLPTKEEKGKQLEPNTPFCQVGDDRALRAVIMVETPDWRLVEKGDRAWIRLHGRGHNYWRGTVGGKAPVEANEVPPQLSNKLGGEIPTQEMPQPQTQGQANGNGGRTETPQQQRYMIYVDFDELDGTIHPGTMGRVKIETQPQTLWWRFKRFMNTTLNWQLWF